MEHARSPCGHSPPSVRQRNVRFVLEPPNLDCESSLNRGLLLLFLKHRLRNNDPNLVDLHGLTIAEAHTVVKEAVTEWYSRSTKQTAPKPLKIVCGIGSHSKDKIARLYPHVLSLLMKDGWRCEAENGVILVKGIKPPTPAPASTSSRTRRW